MTNVVPFDDDRSILEIGSPDIILLHAPINASRVSMLHKLHGPSPRGRRLLDL